MVCVSLSVLDIAKNFGCIIAFAVGSLVWSDQQHLESGRTNYYSVTGNAKREHFYAHQSALSKGMYAVAFCLTFNCKNHWTALLIDSCDLLG